MITFEQLWNKIQEDPDKEMSPETFTIDRAGYKTKITVYFDPKGRARHIVADSAPRKDLLQEQIEDYQNLLGVAVSTENWGEVSSLAFTLQHLQAKQESKSQQ